MDDEYDSREWVASLIRYAGGKATVAASVTEALDVLTREPCDLILSDIGMPDRDGMDFIREVRLRGLSLPAVATTAYTSAAEQTQILLAGYDSFLAKPLDPDYLVAVLSPLLKRRR